MFDPLHHNFISNFNSLNMSSYDSFGSRGQDRRAIHFGSRNILLGAF